MTNGYASLLIAQYMTKPKATATIQALADDMGVSFTGLLSVPDMLDIDNAKGVNLDIIGKIVGQDRTLSGAIEREFFAFTRSQSQTKGYQHKGAGGSPWYRHGDAIASSGVLNDTEFRQMIRVRIIKNFSRCNMDSVEMACELLFGIGKYAVDVIAACEWKITVTNASQFALFCAQTLDILPRASGVNYVFEEK
ncbi:DUF2612 domain-containing protein [Rahnella sp. ChDrAdgB13]|uniref:DUF2612 domain-containing protein n=1 Tax=Rahnella sp. ChDrAdgB13 TaxID=1850581 RepID=UPI001AD86A9D|nr:DUF2612 domain-containing protein [Rahnella sp. ChDrAdgB13]